MHEIINWTNINNSFVDNIKFILVMDLQVAPKHQSLLNIF